MKVSTDACIQGAWTPVVNNTIRVLDVGAGTGLLSLMMAQRLPAAIIDALEWNEDAALQAGENIEASAYSERISVWHQDAREWKGKDKYDLIICNPPFFQNSLKGPDAARNDARHSAGLNPASLIEVINYNLSESGAASVMWPENIEPVFTKMAAEQGLFLSGLLLVKDRADRPVKRAIGWYRKQKPLDLLKEELVIKNEVGSYTDDFVRLLKPFYPGL